MGRELDGYLECPHGWISLGVQHCSKCGIPYELWRYIEKQRERIDEVEASKSYWFDSVIYWEAQSEQNERIIQ